MSATARDRLRGRGRYVGYIDDARARADYLADLAVLCGERDDLAMLLREYAQRGRDIVDPSASSLIGRTRVLLGRLECSAPPPKETAMDFDAFRDRLKARLAKLRERLGHDDPDVQAMEKELEDGTTGSGESQAGRQAP